MSQDCKTEVANGSATQSWEWKQENQASSSFQELAHQAQPEIWAVTKQLAGDSLWRVPVRTCAPELFTVSRLGTITVQDQIWRLIVSRWVDEGIRIWEAPGISLSTYLQTSGLLSDSLTHLVGEQGIDESTVFKDEVTLWSLFWIYLNARAKVIDRAAVWLYTNNNDSGWFEEGFWLHGNQGIQENLLAVESIQLPGSKVQIEWIKCWDLACLSILLPALDSLPVQESQKFNSVRYKSESAGIWEQVVYVAGYGKGSGYGLGDYGR